MNTTLLVPCPPDPPPPRRPNARSRVHAHAPLLRHLAHARAARPDALHRRVPRRRASIPTEPGRAGDPFLSGAREGDDQADRRRSLRPRSADTARTRPFQPAVLACLWCRVFGPQQVQVAFVWDRSKTGYDIALVTTDLSATCAQVVERYAARSSRSRSKTRRREDARPRGSSAAAARPATASNERSGARSPSGSS